MSLAWDTPVTFTFRSARDAQINGRDMYDYINSAVGAFEDGNYGLFGEMIGKASIEILDGRREMKDDPAINHPKPKPTSE